jgi:hypothetical protein
MTKEQTDIKIKSLKLHLEKTKTQLGKNPKKDDWVNLELVRTERRIKALEGT